jgi:hypothetical protein
MMRSLSFQPHLWDEPPRGGYSVITTDPTFSYQQWAVQGQNTPPVSTENQQISTHGAVNRAANPSNSFAEAMAAIMPLPLSDAEKAEAIRRLLTIIESK